MNMTFLKGLVGLNSSPKDELPTPDLSRVLGSPLKSDSTDSVSKPTETRETEPSVDVGAWRDADVEALHESWTNAKEDAFSIDTTVAFRKAIHDLYGASGVYGGGVLTRLTGALQSLVTFSDSLENEQALIELMVQACRRCNEHMAPAETDIADRICSAVEKQFADQQDAA